MIDVTAIPAGRELDAAVAERIEGWKWLTFKGMDTYAILFPPGWYEQNSGHYGWIEGRAAGSVMCIDSEHFYDSRRPGGLTMPVVPAYSTDDGIALRLADDVKLFQRGYTVVMATDGNGDDYYEVCHVQRYANAKPELDPAIAHGATRAEAVCRATLLLVEEEPT